MYEFNPADNIYHPITNYSTSLPLGFYSLIYTNSGYKIKLEERKHGFIDVRPELAEIAEEIKVFWQSESTYKLIGEQFKRGYLFHGIPGCGKTNFINFIIDYIIKEIKGIAIAISVDQLCDNVFTVIKRIKVVSPNIKIAIVIEDLDSADKESLQMLSVFLDGSFKLNNILTLSTTNHLESLPKSFTERPGRFDRLIGVLPPTMGETLKIIDNMNLGNSLTQEDIRQIASQSNSSVASIREAILQKLVFKK